ncbi:hypothetical protein E0L21_18960 [Kosakonia quasisacchari]|uniref:Uncharacterized protein n=1 Tax=Kosakonia quasisacchari TaxID=2529380 RepID=A0A4V2LXP0_9ENTR|nr:hypothetical protein [Kosakonia quasisacchari]TCC01246.1 hypothetical protein E0L21_18960 [Kosakonia quasisacchari]
MLAKLIALLKGNRAESTEFDYTTQTWGHALHFVHGFKEKGKMEITGHYFGAGLIYEPMPKKGDTFTISFTNNRIGVLRVHSIKFYRDPSDMFNATVSFEGLKP